MAVLKILKKSLIARILTALLLGAVLGVFWGTKPVGGLPLYQWFLPLGAIFIRLLKMIVAPMIFFSLVLGAANVKPADLGRIGGKAFVFYLITSGLAALLGLALALLAKPGLGMAASASAAGASGRSAGKQSLLDTFINIVPENPFNALAGGVILQIIFFSILLGIALAFLRHTQDKRIALAAETVALAFEGFSQAMFLIVRWIMRLAPICVFALMMQVFAANGPAVAGPLAYVTGIVYAGFVFQMAAVYCPILFFGGINPLKFLAFAKEAMLTAFVTRSSGGTLPVSMGAAQKMGVPQSVYSFVLPVGATVNMAGTSLYLTICTLFIANVSGFELGAQQMIVLVLAAVLTAVGTAGVPGSGALMLLMALEAVGLHLDEGSMAAAAYAAIFSIDSILDMGRTWINVSGDIVGAAWVSASEKSLDKSKGLLLEKIR